MNKKDYKNNITQNIRMILGIIIIALIAASVLFPRSLVKKELTYKEYTNIINDISKNNSSDTVIVYQNADTPTGSIRIYDSYSDFKYNIYYVANVANELDYLKSHHVNFILNDVKKDINYLPFIEIGLLFFVIYLIFTLIMQLRKPIENGPFDQSERNRNRVVLKSDYRFSDVAGLKEEKEELEEIVDFLKNPNKYSSMGARIPKGVLLVGPPGTGKTLLGKAIAGEANVPFFSIAGSEFVELYVGVGASRVRNLFKDAKKHAPCIVFIDEIDAVARKRGAGLGGGHDEREQTLNQLLVEMDGFEQNSGIIVLAATNRVDILDSAILRPGRFDRKIYVGSPDVLAREEILKVHAKNKKLSDDINLEEYAKITSGFSGADLENLMNEAAILGAKENNSFITDDILNRSLIKVSVGKEKKSKLIPYEDKKITAYHESGHAILVRECKTAGKVNIISIIPTGSSAAGYTLPTPNDDMHMTRTMMLEEIMVCLAGRCAEEIALDDITAGAVSDIQRATEIARNMVIRFGMSEKVGIIDYAQSNEEIMLGRDFGHTKTFSEDTAKTIDQEVKNIIEECHKKAKDIINKNRNILEASAKLLLEKEKIGYAEFEALFNDENRGNI